MRVRLLGYFDVEGVPERRLGSRKGRTLLKVLALARGVPVSVDRIADVLWGDDQPARPADQVGVLASRLRGVLGAERIALVRGPLLPDPDGAWIESERAAVQAAITRLRRLAVPRPQPVTTAAPPG